MLHPNIKVRASKIHGKGLIATSFIPAGTLIWVIDQTETALSLEELRKLPLSQQKLAFECNDRYIILSDGGQYMNHSCDPNTWWTDCDALSALASRDIDAGEEVTYDYATSETNEDFFEGLSCQCGAINCRKMITARDSLNPEFQRRHQGHLPSWVEAFISAHKL